MKNPIAAIKREWHSRGWKTTGRGKLSQGELVFSALTLLSMMATPLCMAGHGKLRPSGVFLVAYLFVSGLVIAWHSARKTPAEKS